MSFKRFFGRAFLMLSCGIFLALFVSACGVFGLGGEKRVDAIANEIEIGRKMLDAIRKDDTKTFYSFLPEAQQKLFTENNYKSVRNQVLQGMGEIESYEYLTQLNAPAFRSHVWKVRFKRSKALDTREDVEQDGLFRIVVFPVKDGQPYVASFAFF